MAPLDRTNLQNAFYWLCSTRGDNNFFGRILNSCRREYTTMPYALAVRVDKHGRFCLSIDLEKYNKRVIPSQLAGLVHEAAHLGFRHYERMIRMVGSQQSMSTDSRLKTIWKTLNLAADLTANDLAVRPLTVGKKVEAFQIVYDERPFPEKFDLPRNLSMEEYFLLLMENEDKSNEIQKAIKDKGMEINANFFGEPMEDEGGGEGENESEGKGAGGEDEQDDEQNDEQNDEQDDDPLEEQTREALSRLRNMSGGELERLANDLQRSATSAVRSAVEQTNRCRGTVPGCMKNVIEELLTEPKVPWPVVLRNHIKSIISNKLVHTTAQPNIALYPVIEDGIEPFPGYTHDFTFRITSCTDTSGSVGNDAYRTFVSEQVAILRQFQGIELQVIHFDHGIQYEETFTRTTTDAEIENVIKSLRQRHGYGGTDFCAPFRRVLGTDTYADWVKEKPTKPLARTDLMVMFTDGFAPVASKDGGPLPRLKPACPVIWVICKEGKADPAMQDIVVSIDD
jgi:predicted metal-dependent peptidase